MYQTHRVCFVLVMFRMLDDITLPILNAVFVKLTHCRVLVLFSMVKLAISAHCYLIYMCYVVRAD